VRSRVAALIAAELLLIAGGLAVVRSIDLAIAPPSLWLAATFAAVLAGLTLLPQIYIENRRHGVWLTAADGAIIVGLFLLGPLATVLSAMVAEAVVALRHRQRPLKLLFNLVSMLGGYTAAAATFAVLGRTDPLDPLAWAAGLLALAACAIWDVASTAALFSLLEQRPFRAVLNGVGPALLSSLTLSAALGLVALVLVHEHPLGLLLVVPVIATLVISTRSVTRAKTDRTRLERLYAASTNLTRLEGREETLAGIAEEGRTLITGSAAVCATTRGDGTWRGVLVDDDGPRPLTDHAVRRVVALAEDGEQGVVDLDGRSVAVELPELPSLVWATGRADGDVVVLVAVLLDLPADEQGEHRADVLATFAAHAATAVANVELHHDVQAALERQVELNRQKSEFVAAVSHELRTPLASVIGSIQTAQRSGGRLSPQQRHDLLELGASQGARLRSLIEDLLLVAAAEHQAVRVEHDSIDPAALLTAVVTDLPHESRDRVRSSIGHVGALLSDRDKLHRILLNLVDNARKYAPSGPIDVEVARDAGTVRFTVDDRGPGIRPEDRERIFERFVQLDGSTTREQGGTGLGLHLCRELADMLGGTLSVGDSPTGGARFTLVLPQRRGRDLVEAVTAPVTAGTEAQLPVSTAPKIRSSPLRRPSGVGAATDPGA
jgi:signal transduction histidine kinase